MKKRIILTLLYCTLTLNICNAFEIQIDTQATASAPWKVGDTIVTLPCNELANTCYRTFLGLTSQGYRVVQDFYENGQKATDPFLIRPNIAFSSLSEVNSTTAFMDALYGNYKSWYPSGAKNSEINVNHTGAGNIKVWYENGQPAIDAKFANQTFTSSTLWDEEGRILNNEPQ